jgi:lysyl-tRNA synthetase class 2
LFMLSCDGLQLRSAFFQAVRAFFLQEGYLEVDTPIRLPVLIPELEIAPFASEDRFLQTSPELCMKRLLAHGVRQLFQICHCFRKEETGQFHATEFTLLEWYHAGWDYLDLMLECERLVQKLAADGAHFAGVQAGDALKRNNTSIALASPWQRISVEDAFQTYAGMSAYQALECKRFDEILVFEVEPNLGWQAPVFLYDYPLELGSLATPKKEDPQLVERFELYICGIEVANGFSELVDSAEQRHRFTAEVEKMKERGRLAMLPEKFLADLERMEKTAGIALGLDRLLMLFMDAPALADVMPLSQDDL